MLIIRDEQIAALGRTGRAVWGAEVSARIWTGQPELCSGKTWIEVRDLVQGALDSAERHGFVGKDDAERFALCTLRHGAQFAEKQAWASAIVNDVMLPPSRKLLLLEQHTPAAGVE